MSVLSPDASPGSGDDCDFAFKTVSHAPHPMFSRPPQNEAQRLAVEPLQVLLPTALADAAEGGVDAGDERRRPLGGPG